MSDRMPTEKLEGYYNGIPVKSLQQGTLTDKEYAKILKKMENKVYLIDKSKFKFKS